MFRHDPSPIRLRRPIKKGGVLHHFHARLNRLPAHLTSEDDWKQEQPGVRLSRVFGVVLGIHVVAIGGLMAYEMFRHRGLPAAATTALRPAAREARPVPGAASHPHPVDTFADDPAHEGMLKHVVAPGERLADIAAQYKVDEKALMIKNRLGDGRPFQSGMKLVIPNNQLHAGAPVPPAPLAATTTQAPASSASSADQPVRNPRTPPASPSDGLVAVTPAPYDPSLPTLPAQPVDETPAAKPAAARSSTVAKPSARPSAAAKKEANVAVTSKKPAAGQPKKAETAAVKPKGKARVHVVKDGDTAYRIAQAYGVNVDQLIRTNGIKPNALRPGTTITIPASR